MLLPFRALQTLPVSQFQVFKLESVGPCGVVFAPLVYLALAGMLESFVLALPNRSVFILLYAGLTALIVRNLYTSESLLEYEDTTGDN